LVTGGLINLSAGNHSLARMLFLKALDRTPDSHQAYMGLGELEYKDENYEAAYFNYDKAVKLSPDNVQAMIGKAKSVRQQNKLNAAIEEINKAIATSPNDITVLTELAIIYDLLGKESLSTPIYQEILERTPDQAASSNNIGLSLLSQKKYDLAILAFQRALSLDSQDSRIKNNLATAYALHGDQLQAINLFKETVGEAAAYNNLGYLYLSQGKLDDAERALRKALDLNPIYYEKAQENLERLQQLRDNS
jgi:tetratricopeptide (TPR) repeat protein